MDNTLLEQLGLSTSHANAYIQLVKSGTLTPPELADKTEETRSNAYKILDKLVDLGLATKSEPRNKLVYRPNNPVALEKIAREQRDTALSREKQVQQALPTLLNFFNTYSEQPGIRFFQGKDGIKQIFNDMLRTGQTIYLIRSPADVKFYDEEFYENFRKKRAQLGIDTYAITPAVSSAIHSDELDKLNRFKRTWVSADDYHGQVEWNLYGNKLAMISYGEEAIGMIIESPQIADSFRQIYELAELAAKASRDKSATV